MWSPYDYHIGDMGVGFQLEKLDSAQVGTLLNSLPSKSLLVVRDSAVSGLFGLFLRAGAVFSPHLCAHPWTALHEIEGDSWSWLHFRSPDLWRASLRDSSEPLLIVRLFGERGHATCELHFSSVFALGCLCLISQPAGERLPDPLASLSEAIRKQNELPDDLCGQVLLHLLATLRMQTTQSCSRLFEEVCGLLSFALLCARDGH